MPLKLLGRLLLVLVGAALTAVTIAVAIGILDHVNKYGLFTTVEHYRCGKEDCSGRKGTF
jgi:hypothetical protein